MQDLELSPAQLALRFISNTKQHVFLTGNAGTGKTTFLQEIVKRTYKRTAVVAPTGIAALNAGGTTIHSLFQLPPATFLPVKHMPSLAVGKSMVYDQSHLIKDMKMYKTKRKLIQEMELLIIDEVSMLRADLLDAIDLVLRVVRKNQQSFGGVQVLFIGDLMQLPPIVRDDMQELMSLHYKSPFFFDSKVLTQNPPVYVELDKIFRQKDQRFITLLNNLRNNRLTSTDEELLNQYHRAGYRPGIHEGVITLTTHNYKADNLNKSALAQLPGISYRYRAEVEGDFPGYMYPTEEFLELKVDSQVMFMKNDSSGNSRYFNGKIGRVVELNDQSIEVECEGDDNRIKVSLHEWENVKFSLNEETREIQQKVVGVFKHFPIKLAWAITIHKSQGLTFEKAIIDPKDAFASGQIYVALSRLRSLEGLILSSLINKDSLFAEQRVLEYSESKASNSELMDLADKSREAFLLQELKSSFNMVSLLSHCRNEVRFRTGDQLYPDQLLPLYTGLEKKAEELQERCAAFVSTAENTIGKLNSKPQDNDLLEIEDIHKQIDGLLGDSITEVYDTLDKKKEKFVDDGDAEQLVQLIYDLREKRALCMRASKLLLKAAKGEILEKSDLRTSPPPTIPGQKPVVSKGEYYKNKYGSGKSSKSKSTAPKKKKGYSDEESFKLFQSGMSVAEIATRRELSSGTVVKHLCTAVEAGKLGLEKLIDAAKIRAIERVLEENQDKTLTEQKNLLGMDFSYDDFRLVIALRKSRSSSSTKA